MIGKQKVDWPSRLLQLFLRLLCSFGETVNKYRNHLVLLWLLLLVILGAVAYYGPEYIENQRLIGR